MVIIINIILCVMLALGVAGFVLSISNKKEIERLNISNEKEIERIHNILHIFKRDILSIQDDVSKLKIEHEKDKMDVYDTIKIFKDIENYVWLSEQEKAAVKLGIDELTKLYNQKMESKDDK